MTHSFEPYLTQYRIDVDNLRYAKELQWRTLYYTIGLDAALFALLLNVKGKPLVLAVLGMALLSMLATVAAFCLLCGITRLLPQYRRRQARIVRRHFPAAFWGVLHPCRLEEDKPMDQQILALFLTVIMLSCILVVFYCGHRLGWIPALIE